MVVLFDLVASAVLALIVQQTLAKCPVFFAEVVHSLPKMARMLRMLPSSAIAVTLLLIRFWLHDMDMCHS